MDQPAEHIPSFDQGWGRPRNPGWSDAGRHGKTQSPMRPLVDVVVDVRTEHVLKMARAVDLDLVEALPAHGPHKALRDGIRARRADRGSDDAAALGAEDRIERPASAR